ncbi:MAG: hypothetical protein JWN04_4612, partial [Myxococcaceae bacterium]|nr:hypothetical protein [Myxococcaceae bacterium]
AARGSINGWVAEKTEQLIPELLPAASVDSLTRFVLTNTVYFNASWQKKFDAYETRDADFTKLDGSKQTVSMMSGALSIPYAEGSGYRAIALPYASDELRFIAILPSDGQFATLEKALSGSWFDALEASFSAKRVALSLPKLDYRAKASLKPAMRGLGMNAAFLSGAMGFAGIDADPDLYISDIIHQAVIKVTEEGTIAAAATAVVGATATSIAQNDEIISFDRPFLIAIVDAPTGALLFVGRVLDPAAK